MATERLSMRKTREVLRQKWLLERSNREVAQSVGVSVGAVYKVVWRARVAGLDWAAVAALADDAALEARIYGPPTPLRAPRPLPDWPTVHAELRRPGMTLLLLHHEYLERHPDGYHYARFCELYTRWRRAHAPAMRQVHRAGDKLFVDYSGKRLALVDPATGEVTDVELFVAVLGASNYTYAEATATQQVPDWIASHVRALAFLGGVPAAIVPDQLRSGVTHPSRYEPGVQRTYGELATHYGTTILPARPAHPRDKAKVETAVLIAQRWIVARLRHERHATLGGLNARIRELLAELNDRVMKTYGASRRELFARLDRPALRPLPAAPFAYAEWKAARVNVDYHVELAGHFYSVPFALVHERVELRYTAATVEVFLRGTRVAAHARSAERGRHTTLAEHMPRAHREHAAWSPARLRRWAATIGPATEALVAAILADRPHPEQGYRSCLGILRLAKRYGDARLEAACARAGAVRARSYRHVAAILARGLDRLPDTAPTPDDGAAPTPAHGNVRGPGYYH